MYFKKKEPPADSNPQPTSPTANYPASASQPFHKEGMGSVFAPGLNPAPIDFSTLTQPYFQQSNWALFSEKSAAPETPPAHPPLKKNTSPALGNDLGNELDFPPLEHLSDEVAGAEDHFDAVQNLADVNPAETTLAEQPIPTSAPEFSSINENEENTLQTYKQKFDPEIPAIKPDTPLFSLSNPDAGLFLDRVNQEIYPADPLLNMNHLLAGADAFEQASRLLFPDTISSPLEIDLQDTPTASFFEQDYSYHSTDLPQPLDLGPSYQPAANTLNDLGSSRNNPVQSSKPNVFSQFLDPNSLQMPPAEILPPQTAPTHQETVAAPESLPFSAPETNVENVEMDTSFFAEFSDWTTSDMDTVNNTVNIIEPLPESASTTQQNAVWLHPFESLPTEHHAGEEISVPLEPPLPATSFEEDTTLEPPATPFRQPIEPEVVIHDVGRNMVPSDTLQEAFQAALVTDTPDVEDLSQQAMAPSSEPHPIKPNPKPDDFYIDHLDISPENTPPVPVSEVVSPEISPSAPAAAMSAEALWDAPEILPDEAELPQQSAAADISFDQLNVLGVCPLTATHGLLLIQSQDVIALIGQIGHEDPQVTVLKIFPENPIAGDPTFSAMVQSQAPDQGMFLVQMGTWKAIIATRAQTILLHTELG